MPRTLDDLIGRLSYSHFEAIVALDDPVARRFYETEAVRGDRPDPREFIRDPYVFEFLGVESHDVMGESALEDALLDKLQAFLLELGHGFCFEARQKRLLIGGEHFFVDLVFYHRVLKCHVLVELKADAFRHEYLGQLNAYVSYYRETQMTEGDQPPVGMNNALFVSRYQVELPNKEEMTAFVRWAVEEVGGDDSE